MKKFHGYKKKYNMNEKIIKRTGNQKNKEIQSNLDT